MVSYFISKLIFSALFMMGLTWLANSACISDTYRDLNAAVLEEQNNARADPKAFATRIESEILNYIGDDGVYRRDSVNIKYNEGKTAVQEAINELKTKDGIATLTLEEGMTKACYYLVDDHGPKGSTGHDSTDGSSPGDRLEKYGDWKSTWGENIAYTSRATGFNIIAQLIIDDGVSSRGHRTNIYKEAFKVTGIGCGYHDNYKNMCVIDYAGGYTVKDGVTVEYCNTDQQPKEEESQGDGSDGNGGDGNGGDGSQGGDGNGGDGNQGGDGNGGNGDGTQNQQDSGHFSKIFQCGAAFSFFAGLFV